MTQLRKSAKLVHIVEQQQMKQTCLCPLSNEATTSNVYALCHVVFQMGNVFTPSHEYPKDLAHPYAI